MPPKPITNNTLFCGDNLPILRETIPTESIDLVYLDPPSIANRPYNVLFKDESGRRSESRLVTFDDTWHWGNAAEETYHQLLHDAPAGVGAMIGALHGFIGANQMMAYLVMMTARLVELRRVLKPTGSLYLHCDPTASHYLKVVLDTVFGPANFRNEIIWKRGSGSSSTVHQSVEFGTVTDSIFFYARSDKAILNPQAGTGAEGIRPKGKPVQSLWDDIEPVGAQSAERLGYPMQKPVALLERIIQASSNPGDVVLDPFCGCGATIAAAQKLGRRWIGIDITHLSLSLQKYRLEAMFPGLKFRVIGEPEDIEAARQLALDDRSQFLWWALSLVCARPLGGQEGSKTGKKRADGVIGFVDDNTGQPKQVLVQVTGGHIGAPDVDQLIGMVEQEKAAMGVLVTLESPTGPMLTEATKAGYYTSPRRQSYRRIQILTIESLLQGVKVNMPPTAPTFKLAPKVKPAQPDQMALDV